MTHIVNKLTGFTDHGPSTLEVGIDGITAIRIQLPKTNGDCLRYEYDRTSLRGSYTGSGAHCGRYEYTPVPRITFVWGSDAGECGLWEGDKMLASVRQLERNGYSLDYILGMSQQQLERLAEKINRDTALPTSVDNTLSMEDFLG